MPVDRVSARAWEAATSVFEVTIPKDAIVDEPTTMRLTGGSLEPAAAGHLLVRAGAFSKAVVVVDYTGSATWAENIEVVLEDGAELTFVTVQDWDDDAVHVVNQHARVGRDANLKHVTVTLGGDVVRASTSADYVGTGGSVEMFGVYFADAGQHMEHRLFVDHTAPHTRSNVDYKGALQGQDAHTVWIGNVLIRKVAEGIDTFEQNDNLVLTDGAHADSVPNLEIETGEIEGAGHASTTGRFDDQHLFYLQSRGIEEEEARRLVVHGFFNDIIRRIGVPDLQERLVAAIEDELAEHVGTAVMAFVHGSHHSPTSPTAAPSPSRSTGVEVALVRDGDDVYAVIDECSHAAIPLSEGEVEGNEIECWLHGSRFDLRTGKPVNLPATEPVQTYPTTIEGDTVLVDLSATGAETA